MAAIWNYIVIATCLLLLAFIAWKEIKRSNKKRLFWRLLASVLAIVSLVSLAIPFSYKIKKATNNSVVLLTENYNKDSLHQFQKNNHLIVYTEHNFPFEDTSFNTVHLFGNGLNEDELQLLNNKQIVFHATEKINGITNIHWQQKIISGEKLMVEGVYNNTHSTAAKIVLTGLNTNLDSVIIAANATQNFSLFATPKHVGKAVYQLSVINKKDTLENNELPVEVNKPVPLKVLLLAASPNFENNFLKNWLYENSNTVVMRTKVSTGKYNQSFYNTKPVNVNSINADLLNNFNLIIGDEQELRSLSETELAALQNKVEQGMGLIVKADTIYKKNTFYSVDFPIIASIQTASKSTTFQTIQSTDKINISTEQLLQIQYRQGTQPLVTNKQQHIFASSSLKKSGKIIYTTIANTYSLLLAGNKEAYSNLWSLLITKAASKKENNFVYVSTVLPVANNKLQIISNYTSPIFINNTAIALQKNNQLPYLWQGNYWASNTGWQSITSKFDTTFFYVFKPTDFKTVIATNKINAVKNYIAVHQNTVIQSASNQTFTTAIIPPFYFFLLLLLSCTYLWVERKL